MRRLLSFVSLCALLAAQTPFAACPAAAREVDAATAAAVPFRGSDTAQHHHAAAAAGRTGGGQVTVPASPGQRNDACTMLKRCDWVAVPTQPVAAEPVRGLASAAVAVPTPSPATSEPSPSTPPPRLLS